MENTATASDNRWFAAAGVYLLALATILYPAYGPGSFVRQGLGTTTQVVVVTAISLIVTAALFGTRLLVRPVWALVFAILGLVGAWAGAEWVGVPVVFGGAAAYFAWQARQGGDRSKVVLWALIIGLLAILSTIGIGVLEPLTD